MIETLLECIYGASVVSFILLAVLWCIGKWAVGSKKNQKILTALWAIKAGHRKPAEPICLQPSLSGCKLWRTAEFKEALQRMKHRGWLYLCDDNSPLTTYDLNARTLYMSPRNLFKVPARLALLDTLIEVYSERTIKKWG